MRHSLSRRRRRSEAQNALDWKRSSGGRKGAARPAFGAALIARGLELSRRAHRFVERARAARQSQRRGSTAKHHRDPRDRSLWESGLVGCQRWGVSCFQAF